jgi:hypothetical protein
MQYTGQRHNGTFTVVNSKLSRSALRLVLRAVERDAGRAVALQNVARDGSTVDFLT